ncbi:MAG: putative bifunctional diguanylate cyclase/phosphodiesterase [Hyphomicrobiales bacterium]
MRPAIVKAISTWSGRLAVRVTLCVGAALLIFAGLVLAATIHEAETMLQSHLSTRADDLSELVAELAASQVGNLEAFELEVLLEDVARQREVKQINVVDPSGGIIADGSSGTSFSLKRTQSPLVLQTLASGVRGSEIGPDSIDLAVPVKLGRKLVGVLHMTMTLEAVGSTLDRIKLHFFLLVMGCLLLTLSIAAILVSHATGAIRRITTAVRGVTHGNLDIQFPRPASGEVGELQQAFQIMLTDLKHGLVEIERLANTDPVTDLPNRRAFRTRLEETLSRSSPPGGALFFVDLDGFKQINDTFGHDCGDDLLKQVSRRLEAALDRLANAEGSSLKHDRPFLARLGGDEFVFLAPGVQPVPDARAIALELIGTFDAPFKLRGQEIGIGASIGVTLTPKDAATYDQLMKCADLAMYAAKDAGRGTVHFYAPELERDSLERYALERELREALVNNELVVHYQPQICCSSGRVTGAEALVRWRHPKRGLLAPGSFLRLAEETGLIDDIGWYVLDRAARDCAALAESGRPISISVNLSALQFERTDFSERIFAALESAGLSPQLLELELTESIAMRDPERAIARLQPLRDRGVRFAIDDFGTGYSSLSYLSRLPIDTIKIDGSFIRAVGADANTLVTIILQMAKSLRLRSVAEGIETEVDFAFVRSHGVDAAQGFLFSPALPLREFTAFLAAFHSWPAGVEADRQVARLPHKIVA